MKRHCRIQQLVFASPMKGIQPVGSHSYKGDTIHFEHLVCRLSYDERPRIRCFVYSATRIHQSDFEKHVAPRRSPVTEAREHLFASLHRFKESRDILGTVDCYSQERNVVQEQVTHPPIEMSIRITASLAPPAFPVALRITEIARFFYPAHHGEDH